MAKRYALPCYIRILLSNVGAISILWWYCTFSRKYLIGRDNGATNEFKPRLFKCKAVFDSLINDLLSASIGIVMNWNFIIFRLN